VPQSPWSINDTKPNANTRPHSVSENNSHCINNLESGLPICFDEEKRKGRSSVEEIVAEAVKISLRANLCRMHACGREDIDVRCLGNGRPFALEVLGARELPTPELLQEAVTFVMEKRGLNSQGDIELLFLREEGRDLWEGMQTSAEEKKKGYCCVAWSASPLTRQDLDRLEQVCRNGPYCKPDKEGKMSLEVNNIFYLYIIYNILLRNEIINKFWVLSKYIKIYSFFF